MTKLVEVIARGLAADRPAPGDLPAGSLYYSTDTGSLDRTSGSAWESVNTGSAAPTGAAGGVLGGTYPDPTFAVAMATQAELDAVAAAAQPLDGDLTAIAALTPSNDDVIQRKAGAWTNRTVAQLVADLIAAGAWTEAVQDVIGAMVAAAGGSYDDGAGTITLPSGGTLTLAELDGSPSGAFDTLKFPNGTLTNNGDGSATYTPSGGGGNGVGGTLYLYATCI